MSETTKQAPYSALVPGKILHAVEKITGPATGAVFTLNSFENRVYQVELENGPPVIAKFYRPQRWSKATIEEEHAFAAELATTGVDVVAPLAFDHKTLFEADGFFYALYPKRGGRPFEVRGSEDLRQLGRLLARVHNVGAIKAFKHRPHFTVPTYGAEALNYLQNSPHTPAFLAEPLRAIAGQTLEVCGRIWAHVNPTPIRLHGDCHAGNILVHTDPFLVDLDDCAQGPAMQDIWMLLPGEGEEIDHALNTFIEGYEVFRSFPFHEKPLIEVLRTLRMLHYTAWLAKRWEDPSFPKNFPFFGQVDYWQKFVGNLQQQFERLL